MCLWLQCVCACVQLQVGLSCVWVGGCACVCTRVRLFLERPDVPPPWLLTEAPLSLQELALWLLHEGAFVPFSGYLEPSLWVSPGLPKS